MADKGTLTAEPANSGGTRMGVQAVTMLLFKR